MATHLQQLIGEAQALSPHEQIELISAVSQSLHRNHQHSFSNTAFWQPTSIEQLIKTQAIRPIQNIMQLPYDDEAEDETADEMVAYIDGQRQLDQLRDV